MRGLGTRPLVAVPVVGIGLGGYGKERGTVLRQLVDRLTTSTARLDVDVALVTPDPAVYAAAQYARAALPSPLPEELESRAHSLGRQAQAGDLALFLGAGVGVPAGLPSWPRFVADLATEFDVRDLGSGEDSLSVTDQAELIQRVARDQLQKAVATRVRKHTQPSLLHALLAGLDCRETVTTNYDLLYESAVRSTGREIGSVLPWGSAHGHERWVLKLHGDVDHSDKIVLTRRHMVMYDAVNRPSGALLQSLLLTKRVLIVGASMSDDNVVRLLHEVQSYRTEHESAPTATFGTLLDVAGSNIRARLWEGQLDWVSMSTFGPDTGARMVELFLDRVALHATRDSSWLLDARFEGLLENEQDRQLAREIRALHRRLPRQGTSGTWSPLVRRLQELGVEGPTGLIAEQNSIQSRRASRTRRLG